MKVNNKLCKNPSSSIFLDEPWSQMDGHASPHLGLVWRILYKGCIEWIIYGIIIRQFFSS
jgi:hypothetical protein